MFSTLMGRLKWNFPNVITLFIVIHWAICLFYYRNTLDEYFDYSLMSFRLSLAHTMTQFLSGTFSILKNPKLKDVATPTPMCLSNHLITFKHYMLQPAMLALRSIWCGVPSIIVFLSLHRLILSPQTLYVCTLGLFGQQ